jgi:GC-rich sequence DNA-binding factor
VPLLEKLEDEYVSLLTERYDMISRRRQEDDADDLVLFFHVPPTEDPGEPEVDEFGRSVDTNSPHSVVRRARRADRTARLSSRHSSAPSQPQSAPTQTPEDEGYLTDSALSPSNLHDFQLALKTLSDKLSSILSDVQAEEFRNPQVGLAKWFGEWRSKFTETYVGAWGGLGLVGAWEFWSRVEMLGWDPLEVCSSSLQPNNFI